MKSSINSLKVLFVFSFIILTSATYATELSYNISTFPGGYNVSCHGAHDGWINLVVVAGNPPYLYTWSNGSFSQNQTNLGVGTYTVVVSDAQSNSASATIEIKEPKTISLTLVPKTYEGNYNISSQGSHDGEIHLSLSGGVMPYTYLWSTSSTDENIVDLVAGSYSVIVTDENGCTISGSKTLIEPTELKIDTLISPLHNGYNISCREGHDGAIDLSVSGGVPPYVYQWSNGQFTQDISDLEKGIYWVIVKDANETAVAGQIRLTQPSKLNVDSLTSVTYNNGYNVTCYSCTNGSITASVSGGVQPYTYHWSVPQTTSTITNLGRGSYELWMSDANGCSMETKEYKTLYSPDKEDWSLNGNTNTGASSYIGTNDSNALTLKVNNAQVLKLQTNKDILISGKLKFQSSFTDSISSLFVDQNGVVRIGDPGDPNNTPCNFPSYAFYRKRCTSGSLPDANFYFVGSANPNAKLIIGSPQYPTLVSNTATAYKMYVAGGILTEKLRVAIPNSSYWADNVFDSSYKLKPLSEVKDFISVNKHLPDVPSVSTVLKDGVDVVEMQAILLEKIENLYLYIMNQQSQIETLQQQLINLQK